MKLLQENKLNDDEQKKTINFATIIFQYKFFIFYYYLMFLSLHGIVYISSSYIGSILFFFLFFLFMLFVSIAEVLKQPYNKYKSVFQALLKQHIYVGVVYVSWYFCYIFITSSANSMIVYVENLKKYNNDMKQKRASIKKCH